MNMSHTFSQHYQFVISCSWSIEWDLVGASGRAWRRAAADAVWNALEQGRLSFSEQGPFIYNSRELHHRNLIEHWRMRAPADNNFWSPREGLLEHRGNEFKEKQDSNSR